MGAHSGRAQSSRAAAKPPTVDAVPFYVPKSLAFFGARALSNDGSGQLEPWIVTFYEFQNRVHCPPAWPCFTGCLNAASRLRGLLPMKDCLEPPGTGVAFHLSGDVGPVLSR
jgi:hypothetical protein